VEVLRCLAEKGYERLPSEESIRTRLDDMGYRPDHWFHLEKSFCFASLGPGDRIVYSARIEEALSIG
jgi:hypothetical protein